MSSPIRLLARGSSQGHADLMIDIPGENSLQNSCERQERSLADDALGEDHPEVLTAMLDLADCLWTQGRLIAARNLEEQVVEGRRRQLGEQHADTLKAIGKLAVTLAAQGNLAQARLLQEQVVAGRRSLFGEADLETLRAINNLAGTVASQGDLAAARELLEAVFANGCPEVCAQRPDRLPAMSNLGAVLVPGR